MSLIFTSGASIQAVRLGSGKPLEDLNPLTLFVWVYPTSITNNRFICQKAATGPTGSWRWQFKDGFGDTIAFIRERATTNLEVVASNSWSTSAWNFVLVSISDSTTNTDQRMFLGALGTQAIEVTYNDQIAGSGTFNSDAGNMAFLGGNGATTTSNDARFAVFGVINAHLTTTGEVRRIQNMTRPWIDLPKIYGPKLRGLWLPGFQGAGLQPDYSDYEAPSALTLGIHSGARFPYFSPMTFDPPNIAFKPAAAPAGDVTLRMLMGIGL